MIQPTELKTELPMEVSNSVFSTTTKVWQILLASKNGDLDSVKALASECPELLFAQYNYTPPIHFAVREGHLELVKYLLENGAHDPAYRIYPFQESLDTIAEDRGFMEILSLLEDYNNNPARQKHKGDNGMILYNRTELQTEFENAAAKGKIDSARKILITNPEFAKDETYFWGEGILLFAAKSFNLPMIDLLMSYGARVPDLLKWTQFYYFERLDSATYLMEKGMNPNTMSWHHVSILHDMAQKGNIPKAELLIKHGADFNALEEEYCSTPLGMAARWGHLDMVKYLINCGADINKSGASWSTPIAWARKKGFGDIEDFLLNAGGE